jgi:2,5-furandicarboxylate decarboxylase 1
VRIPGQDSVDLEALVAGDNAALNTYLGDVHA